MTASHLIYVAAGEPVAKTLSQEVLCEGRTDRQADDGSQRTEKVRDRCRDSLVFGASIGDERNNGTGQPGACTVVSS